MRNMTVELEGDVREGYYRAWYRCTNCGVVFQYDMVKGRSAIEMNGKCPTCQFESKPGTAGGAIFPIIKYNHEEYDKQQRYYFM